MGLIGKGALPTFSPASSSLLAPPMLALLLAASLKSIFLLGSEAPVSRELLGLGRGGAEAGRAGEGRGGRGGGCSGVLAPLARATTVAWPMVRLPGTAGGRGELWWRGGGRRSSPGRS